MKVVDGYKASLVEDRMYCDGEKVGEGLEDRLKVCQDGRRGRHCTGASLDSLLIEKFSQS